MTMDDIPYLARGVKQLGTDSSVLVSSSKYLNNDRLRQWIAFIALKKNGPDYPPAAEMYELIGILSELRDFDHIEHMISQERKVNPRFDAWFAESSRIARPARSAAFIMRPRQRGATRSRSSRTTSQKRSGTITACAPARPMIMSIS
jgi:hypothetical protein